MGWSDNVWCSADRWVKVEEMLKSIKKAVPSDRWIELKYKQLITSPENELKRICGFIQTQYSNSTLTYHETSTYDKPRADLAYKWESVLSKYETRLIESRALTALLDIGYKQSCLPHMRLSQTFRQILMIEDKVVRICFQVRRYGFMLYALLFVARKLNLEQ